MPQLLQRDHCLLWGFGQLKLLLWLPQEQVLFSFGNFISFACLACKNFVQVVHAIAIDMLHGWQLVVSLQVEPLPAAFPVLLNHVSLVEDIVRQPADIESLSNLLNQRPPLVIEFV